VARKKPSEKLEDDYDEEEKKETENLRCFDAGQAPQSYKRNFYYIEAE
jgi:hypothetical protein